MADTKMEIASNSPVSEFTSSLGEMFIKLNEFKGADARFITITALDLGEEIEVIYHFEKDFGVVGLKIKAKKDKPLPSITSIYPVAFIAENEVQDLFNLKFSGLNVDFGGKMLHIEGIEQDTLLKPAEGPEPPIMRFFGKCREECPSNVNAPKYIRQISMGDAAGAYDTVIEQAPLPACLGRVCFAPCQEGCRQEMNEEPIQIRLLKRYCSDSIPNYKRKVKRAKSTGKKVAVVGGGPSGVSAAFYLGMLGHEVTVYEKTDRCGGAMLWGIPKYRLPKNILGSEITARFGEAKVTLKEGTEVKELKPLLDEGFDAIYVAIGAMESFKLQIEGEESEGVWDCKDLLEKVNVYDEIPNLGDRVAIVGGGNSAIDSGRVAKRLGASEVVLYYRRTEREMPASAHEIRGAVEEGVSFEYLVSPLKIIPGKPLQLVLQNMELGEPDASGRRRPMPIEGSTTTVEVDSIMKAIGHAVVVPEGFGIGLDRRGRIVASEDYETDVEGIFAGGDSVFGPKSVIEALRDGRKAASAINKFLGGEGLPEPSIDMGEYVGRPENLDEIKRMEHVQVREISPEVRAANFDEVELGFSDAEALRESSRCWRCDWNE
ncbi:MAG TPA: FAD-dependent oxidoreductase [Patescibacteria group bacterium]|nr:FAD-dependent oxidoreductase [Patescibacteria group bacterium]